MKKALISALIILCILCSLSAVACSGNDGTTAATTDATTTTPPAPKPTESEYNKVASSQTEMTLLFSGFAVSEYNKNGHLLSRAIKSPDTMQDNGIFWYLTYDESGKPVAAYTSFYDGHDGKVHFELSFDPSGALVSLTGKHEDENLDITVEFNESGKISREKYTDGKMEYRIEYDDSGRTVSETMSMGGQYITFTHTHEDKQTDIEMTANFEDAFYPEKITIKYNDNGELVSYDDTQTQISYEYENGRISFVTAKYDTDTSKTKHEYDKNGSCVKTTVSYIESGVLSSKIIYEYEYDAKGKRIGEIITYNDGQGTTTRKKKYEYDASGNTVFYELTKYEGGKVCQREVRECIYNAKDELIKEVEKHYKNGIDLSGKEEFEYKYDQNGNLVEMNRSVYDSSNVFTGNTVYLYTYDANGRQTSETFCEYDKNNKLIEKTVDETEYDANGNVTKESETEYDANGAIAGKDVNTYEYNPAGVLVKLTELNCGEGGKKTHYYEIHFDDKENGVYTCYENYDENGVLADKEVFETEYDASGNRTKQIYTKYKGINLIIEKQSENIFNSDGNTVKSTETFYDESGAIFAIDVYDIIYEGSTIIGESCTYYLGSYLGSETFCGRDVYEYEYNANGTDKKSTVYHYDQKNSYTGKVVTEYEYGSSSIFPTKLIISEYDKNDQLVSREER